MRASFSRRRFLNYAAAGLSMAATSAIARAQTAVQPPPKPIRPDEYSVTAPVSIEVNARPLPSFDTRDRSHVRFGSLEYRSGLVLTSSFRGFGGLSGLRLDAKGETLHRDQRQGQLVHRPHRLQGPRDDRPRRCRGLADARARRQGRSRRAAGSIPSRSRSTARYVYVGLERVNQVLRFDFAKGFTRSRGEVVPMPPAATQAAVQQGAGSAGDGAEGLCRWRAR